MAKERFKVDNVVEVKNDFFTNYHSVNNLYRIIKYAIDQKLYIHIYIHIYTFLLV
jgi:hypothetical protein